MIALVTRLIYIVQCGVTKKGAHDSACSHVGAAHCGGHTGLPHDPPHFTPGLQLGLSKLCGPRLSTKDVGSAIHHPACPGCVVTGATHIFVNHTWEGDSSTTWQTTVSIHDNSKPTFRRSNDE